MKIIGYVSFSEVFYIALFILQLIISTSSVLDTRLLNIRRLNFRTVECKLRLVPQGCCCFQACSTFFGGCKGTLDPVLPNFSLAKATGFHPRLPARSYVGPGSPRKKPLKSRANHCMRC